MVDNGRETPSIGAFANRAFFVDGDPGGDEGARFAPPALEGFTSWVMYCLPRETAMVMGVVVVRLTKRGDGDRFWPDNDSMYWMEANAMMAMLRWEWRARQLGREPLVLLKQGGE